LEIGKSLIDWTTLLKALEKHGFDGVFGIDIGGNSKMREELDGMILDLGPILQKP
jgi:sugar phosphate isomerase/epimerase